MSLQLPSPPRPAVVVKEDEPLRRILAHQGEVVSPCCVRAVLLYPGTIDNHTRHVYHFGSSRVQVISLGHLGTHHQREM